MLAESGFDVYLANLRGTIYSKQHVSLTSDDDKYWHFRYAFHRRNLKTDTNSKIFSQDEIVDYEIPSLIKKVLTLSGSPKLTYIGYNAGSTLLFEYASRNASLASQQIQQGIVLGWSERNRFWQFLLGKHSDIVFKILEKLGAVKYFSDGKYPIIINYIKSMLDIIKPIEFLKFDAPLGKDRQVEWVRIQVSL